MTLLLSVLRCPDSAVPEQRRVSGGDFMIGRGADCDWVLLDPEGVLSRRHCVLEFRSGGWQVRDLSTNGTFVNHAAEPIGRDQVRPLEDGDRLRIGGYEIELRIEQDAADVASVWGGGGAAAGPGWAAHDAAADPGWDPLAPPRPVGGGAPAALPDDFDPFAEDAAPPMPDHRPSVEDVFVPPPVIPAAPVAGAGGGGGAFGGAAGAAPPGGEDWDLDLSPPGMAPTPAPGGMAPPAGGGAAALDDWDLSPPVPGGGPAVVPPVPAPPPPMPTVAGAAGHQATAPSPTPPVAPPVPPVPPVPAATAPVAAGPAAAAEPGDFDPFAEEAPLTAAPQASPVTAAPANATPAPHPAAVQAAPGGALPDAAAAVAMPVAAPSPGPVGATPVQPMPAVAAASAPAMAATGASGASGLAAFLAGAGLAPGALSAQVADPDAALRGLGAAFRAVISGLRALLIARADVKREFRIEQTLLRAAGNNPVKFAATDDAAVLALAAQGARGVAAVEETISDLTAHQVATLAATQAAARALLERLAPAGLEAEVKGGGSLFGASREKLLWEAYKKLHQQVVEQFDDDFDSAFGKAFARAYEQAARRGDGGGAG